jgi:hypothetical protein
MSTRRSRPPRSRKVRASEPPPTDLAALAAATNPVITHTNPTDSSQTAELRALEAGWDELLA